MGNTKGAHFKDQFGRNQFANLEVGHDNLLGSFSVIRLQGPPTTTSLVKVLDPRIYDDYSDIGEAVRKISQDHPHVSSLLFVSENRQNPEFYNLAFEYGEPQNTFIYEEPVLWSYIEQVVEGLLFVESQGYHYPVLSKQYLLLTGKGLVKLLNPYAFTDFMKEILQIYLNPQNPMSNRRSYFMMQVARNIKELGVMVATLVSNCNEYQLKTDPGYANKVVDAIAAKFSKNLVAAMRALIQNNGQLKSFSDVKALIQKLKVAAPEGPGAMAGPGGFASSYSRDQGPMTPLAKQPGQGFGATSPLGPTQPPMTPKAEGGSFKTQGPVRENPIGGQPFYPEDQRKLKIFDNPSTGSFKQYPGRPDQSQYQVFQPEPNLAQKYQTNPAGGFGQTPSLFDSQVPQDRLSSLPNIPLPNIPPTPPQSQLQPALQRSPSPPSNQFEPPQANPGSFRQTQQVSTVQSAPPQILNPKPPGLNADSQKPGNNLPQMPAPQTTRVQSTPGNPLLFNIQNTFGSSKTIEPVNQAPPAQPPMAFPVTQSIQPPPPQFNVPPPAEEQPNLIPEEGEEEHLDQDNPRFLKRTSLNSEPIIHSNDKPNYLFVNSADPHNVNVTSYFQRRESGIGVGLLDGQINPPTFRKVDFFDTEEGEEEPPYQNKLAPMNPPSEFRQDPLGASQLEPPPAGWNLTPTVISQRQEEPREQKEARDSYGGSQSQIQNNFPPSQPIVGMGQSLNNSQTGFPPQQPPQTIQPQAPAPPQPVQPPQQPERQKMIVKINIRWLPDEKRHQKVVEYDDKTTEELPFTEEEKLKFISGPAQPPQPPQQQPLQPPSPMIPTGPVGFNQPQSPQIPQSPTLQPQSPHQPPMYQPQPKPAPYQPPTQTRQVNAYPPQQPQQSPNQQGYQPFPPNFANDPMAKASHIVHYNVPTESPSEHTLGASTLIQNCATLCLFPEGSENSVLLFRSRPLNNNGRFADVGNIVNRRDPLAPSCYHNVEQPMLTGSSIFGGKRDGSAGELTHITREEYHKPVSMDNLPRVDTKPAMPTSLSKPSTILSSNARVIKKI